MKNTYVHQKSENRATDKSYGAKCTEFDNKSNGISPGPRKSKKKRKLYINSRYTAPAAVMLNLIALQSILQGSIWAA